MSDYKYPFIAERHTLCIILAAVIVFAVIRFLVWFIPRYPLWFMFACCAALAAWIFCYAGGGDK